MSALRAAALVASIAVNGALLGASGAPSLAWLHPVAPPLTHIPGMGEAALAEAGSAGAAAPPRPPTGAETPPSAPQAPGTGGPPAPGAGAPPVPGAGGPPAPGTGGPPGGPPPAPALRGIAGFLDHAVRAVGTPDQRSGMVALAADPRLPLLARRATELRLAVQGDAVALADALGPDRVGAILAAKDALSTRIGEGRAWSTAAERLR